MAGLEIKHRYLCVLVMNVLSSKNVFMESVYCVSSYLHGTIKGEMHIAYLIREASQFSWLKRFTKATRAFLRMISSVFHKNIYLKCLILNASLTAPCVHTHKSFPHYISHDCWITSQSSVIIGIKFLSTVWKLDKVIKI